MRRGILVDGAEVALLVVVGVVAAAGLCWVSVAVAVRRAREERQRRAPGSRRIHV
jgi:hypothetical protein